MALEVQSWEGGGIPWTREPWGLEVELTARVCASCVQDPEEREKSVVAWLSADSVEGALYKLGLDKEGAKPCVMLTTGVARTE